jgi:trehalose synthase-fused probable maltokinase
VAAVGLPKFLQRQRWYPAKDADISTVSLSALVRLPDCGVPAAVAVWQVNPAARQPLHLFLPLALVSAEQADPAQVIAAAPADVLPSARDLRIVEAFSVDSFVRAWIGMLLRGGEEASGSVLLRTGRTDRLPLAGLETGDWAIRRGRAEQSNTSIRIGDGAILKVIRKLESGIHPELEVGRFLTEIASFAATPPMLAWAELEDATGAAAMTLSVLQAFVPNEGDGWSWVLERLAQAGHPGGSSTEALEQTRNWLRRLGRRTAELHTAFASNTTDQAFRPEPVEAKDIQTWVAAAQTSARRAFDSLTGAARLDPQAQDLAEGLLARRDELVNRLARILDEASAFTKIRHHGDYHLGQVLATGQDAVIIDFEGEPLRPLAERRAKHAALRDVAGMLRSIAYAGAAASRALPQGLSQAGRVLVEDRLAAWEAEASQAFLDGYFEAARGGAFCPADRDDADRVVRFFMLEKALYEISYESANRPDWVTIPLRGILALLEKETAAR